MKSKSIPARVGAALAALATLGALWVPGTARKATAETPETKPRPYVAATILSHEDGTGFGTPAAPWLTEENGFPVGDEGPHDGVVTTGDSVHYRVRLAFQAAKARDVTVFVAGSKYLTEAAGNTCPSGVNVTGKASGSGCTYSIPAGVAESVDVDLYMTAGDTAGKAVTGIKPELRLARSDGATDSLQLGALTIVSARNADLVVDNGALSGNEDFPYACDKDSALAGGFNLKVVPLKRQGYTTTHGSSTRFPWQAVADVSAWPASTVWRWGDRQKGTILTPVGGMLHLPQVTGNANLYYSVPTKDVTVDTHVYDIHVIVQSGFPQGQPGDQAPRDASTYDKDLGSSDGRPYANNDWSRGKLRKTTCRAVPSDLGGDELSIRFPYPDYDNQYKYWEETMWDDTHLNPPFNYALSYAVIEGKKNAAEDIGIHAKMQASVDMKTMAYNEGDDYWSFDSGLEFTSLPVVTDKNGNTVAPGPNTYVIKYGTTMDTDPSRLNDAPPKDLSTIRVVFIHRYDRTFNGTATWDLVAASEGVNEITGYGAACKGSEHGLLHAGTITVKKPGLWTAITKDSQQDAEPYDKIHAYFGPKLKDLPSTYLDMTSDIDICVSSGLSKVTVESSWWTFSPTTKQGCSKAWTAHVAGHPNWDEGGFEGDPHTGSIGVIEMSAIVKPTATGTQTISFSGTLSSARKGDIAAQTQNIGASSTITVTAPAKAASSISDNLRRDRETDAGTVDPGSAVGMRSTLYVHGPQAAGPASMVIQLPNKADKALASDGKGPDGTWHEYDRGSSTMTATLTGEPVVDTDLTAGQVALRYSTDSVISLDPAKRTWQDAAAITDWSKVTAILVTATPDKAGGTAAATISFSEKTPDGTSGQTDTWASAPYVDGKALTGTPWPDWLQQKFGSISGHLFDDVNGNGKFDDGEDQTVDPSWTLRLTVYKSDEQGTKGDRVSGAWANAERPGYQVIALTSGWWLVETNIDPSKPNSRDILGYGTTYYGKPDGLKATTPTTRLIQLGVGHDYTGADFGVHADKPRVTVRQSTQRDDCAKDTCKVTVNTTIRNTGSHKLSADQATLHSRTGQTVSDDDVIWNETRFKSIRGHTAIDKEGHVWIAGRTYGGGEDSIWSRVPDLHDINIAVTDYNYVYAIDTKGQLLIINQSGSKYWPDYGVPTDGYEGNAAIIGKPDGVTRWADVTTTAEYTNFDDLLFQDQDGNLWEWDDSGWENRRFVKISTGGVTFDLSKSVGPYFPGSDGRLYMHGRDYNSRLFTYLSDSDRKAVETGLVPMPVDYTGGPANVTDITEAYGGGYANNFAVRDNNGALWLLWITEDDGTCHSHWKRVDTHGVTVARLVPHRAYIESPVYFLDTQGGAWLYNPAWIDTGGEELRFDYQGVNEYYGQWGAPDKTEHPGTLTRVASAWTFTALDDVNPDTSQQTYVGLTEEGRPIAWGVAPQNTTGVDPFDSTPSDHSADATQHVSSITPIATTTTDGWTTNDYAMPYDLMPGDEYTLRRTFTVPKGKEATVMALQSWFDSPDTPYSGIKAHRDENLDKPTLPDPAQLGEYWEYGALNGNASCLMGGHLFGGYESSKLEDSCEQTAARIPAASTTPVVGSIAGLAWRDKNRDGRRQTDEPLMPFVHVTLRTKDGDTAGRAVTDGNGAYRFDGLAAGEYVAWFTSDSGLTWTTRLNTDPAAADDDSDVSADLADWGSTGTLTVSAKKPDWTHVDAGLADRTESGLPLTGRIGIAAMLAIMLAILGLGVALARRR